VETVTIPTLDFLCRRQACVQFWVTPYGVRMYTVYVTGLHPASGDDLNQVAIHLSCQAGNLRYAEPAPREQMPTPRRPEGLVTRTRRTKGKQDDGSNEDD
jgi:hypothetical protein